MTYRLTITSAAMRDINRSAILEIIRRESPISRSTIAERLGVSLPTVMRIVDDLISEGFVRLQGGTEWSGGRRRPLLEFDAEGHLVIGVDMGGTKIFGALSDLGGTILDEVNIARHGSSGEDSFNRLTTLIDTLLASPKLDGRQVHGIGVGAPGITLHTPGIVTWANTLHWKNFPSKPALASVIPTPSLSITTLTWPHWVSCGSAPVKTCRIWSW